MMLDILNKEKTAATLHGLLFLISSFFYKFIYTIADKTAYEASFVTAKSISNSEHTGSLLFQQNKCIINVNQSLWCHVYMI